MRFTSTRILARAVNCTAAPDKRPCGECAVCRSLAEGRSLDLQEARDIAEQHFQQQQLGQQAQQFAADFGLRSELGRGDLDIRGREADTRMRSDLTQQLIALLPLLMGQLGGLGGTGTGGTTTTPRPANPPAGGTTTGGTGRGPVQIDPRTR